MLNQKDAIRNVGNIKCEIIEIDGEASADVINQFLLETECYIHRIDYIRSDKYMVIFYQPVEYDD